MMYLFMTHLYINLRAVGAHVKAIYKKAVINTGNIGDLKKEIKLLTMDLSPTISS